ncbi:NAD(P)H-binding protein [Microbispora rosea]
MILITGATGAVGRLVVQQLLAEGARVRAVSRSPREVREVLGRPAWTYADRGADHGAALRKG